VCARVHVCACVFVPQTQNLTKAEHTVYPLNTARYHYLFSFCVGTHERIETYKKYHIYFGQNCVCVRVRSCHVVNCAFSY
jgi:hypothetical protein